MKIVFSRKGFDTSSGGGPSPVVDGRPLSLPIPAGKGRPGVSYASLGLSRHVRAASRDRLSGRSRAHHDPMFVQGRCLFGQCGAAQTHLENRGVGPGDLFVFFGLFRDGDERPHHRLFGWLRVERLVRHGEAEMAPLRELQHPHALAPHGANDVVWCGSGDTARTAHPDLRLSVEDGPPSLWRIPRWLERTGLSYHDRADRWRGDGVLQSVARGQEFVADVGDDAEALDWAERVIGLME